MNKKDEYGYTCACGKKHHYPPYVIAHKDIELVHTCECGRKNIILICDRMTAIRWQARLKALGVCPHCPPPRELLPINPRTGKRYHYCQQERERRRLAQQARRQKAG